MENYEHLKYWEWQIDADCVDIYLPENIVSIMIIIACIQAETNYYWCSLQSE